MFGEVVDSVLHSVNRCQLHLLHTQLPNPFDILLSFAANHCNEDNINKLKFFLYGNYSN